MSAAKPRVAKRKRRWLRILLLSICGLLAVLTLATCLGVLWLRSAAEAALPVLDGDVYVSGLSAPVTVRRDAHGVPHIEAATQLDLFAAQGYVTAQDRLWQMDVFRRSANGELAEIMGPSLVRHDKAQRDFQFRNTARRIYVNMPAEDRARYEAYARGVNLYIAQNQNSLPPEFRLLHYKPQPWSGADSISIGMMMVDMLDTHWYSKLARERIAAKLHNQRLESDLYPVGSWRDHPPTGVLLDLSKPHAEPEPAPDENEDEDRSENSAGPTLTTQDAAALKGHGFSRAECEAQKSGGFSPRGKAGCPTDLPSGAKARPSIFPASARLKPRPFKADDTYGQGDLGVLRDLLGLADCAGCTPGSNNWVISGAHTASGKPLLSNDMHLGLNEPNIWFMADLRTPGFHAAGVTLPGVPYVIAGHNEHVAWGFTALYGDTQDLYVEKIEGSNYEDNDGHWKPLSVDHEVIHVRGRKDVQYDVRSTAHGPLLDPTFTKDSRAIALKWTLYDSTLNSIPLYEIDTASNWTEFSAALAQWCWPTQSVVYSDDQGHIGFHAVGRVPIRWGGMGSFDKPLPHDTSNPPYEWGIPKVTTAKYAGEEVYIPFENMPNAFDPPSGFLATANSRVTTDKSPYQLTDEWAEPYRAERIYKMLQGRDSLRPADMLAVQTDIYSEMDQELAHRFAYAIDHADSADDRLHAAADLMRSWDGRLTTDSAAASLVTQTRKALWPLILEPKVGNDAENYRWSESNFAEEEIVMHASPEWLPPGYKDWDSLLTEAVRRGMKDGKAPSDVSKWAYGGWHVVDIEHPLAGFLPLIGRIAGTGPQPLSGDTTTVKQVGRDFGPSQRFTMDWGNVDGSTEDIVLGESGNPYSAYFRDQWDDYYGGKTFAMPFSEAAVAAQTRHTLRLLP